MAGIPMVLKMQMSFHGNIPCQHKVSEKTLYYRVMAAKHRKNRNEVGYSPRFSSRVEHPAGIECCGNSSSYQVDGLYFCASHAGQFLLNKLEVRAHE